MNFQFMLGNHNEVGKRSLEDPMSIIAAQLRALGHQIRRDDNSFITAAAGYNVVVEGFYPEIIQKMAEGHRNGARFIIIATEEPTPAGFNHGLDRGMRERQIAFPEAARFADAILALVPGTEDWYGRFAPAAHIELGYAPSLIRVNRVRPDHEFGFYGSLSKRRRAVLEKLGARAMSAKAVRVIASLAEGNHRDAEMQGCKVIVQVRLDDKMGLVSSSRCCTALHLGRPVVAEPHQLSKPWDEIVHFAPTMTAFYDDAMRIRERWAAEWDKQFDRLRKTMSPQNCIGHALDVVGITRGKAA